MIKLLIADDERIIRETISNLIDWSALGVTLVGLAKDGNEAYSMILDECPDIVLTDIRMPGLSGLDLIRKTAELNTNTQFIILSGYSEFEYAKQAMEYGVRHYILKPCNEKQIESCIRKVIETISEQRPFQQMEEARQQFVSTMHHQLLMNILHDGLYLPQDAPEEQFHAIFHKYQKFINFRLERYDLFELEGIDAEHMESAVRTIERYQHQHAPGILFSYICARQTLFLLFPTYREVYPELMQVLQTVTASVQWTQKGVVLGKLLPELLHRIAKYEIFRYSDGTLFTTIYNYKNLIRDFDRNAAALFDNDLQVAADAKQALREQLSAISDVSLLKQLASSLMLMAASKSVYFSALSAAEFMIEMESLDNCSEIASRLLQKMDRIYEDYHASHRAAELSDMIHNYVREHISDPRLSLKWISENVLYMNVDYVSRKFFKETGEKFSNYVTNVRIQRAKELLAHTESDKIQYVAEQVGCGNNPQYFSQIFKKQTGQTPSAYIRMIRGK